MSFYSPTHHEPVPRCRSCGAPWHRGQCFQEEGMKARVWEKLTYLAGWVAFWRNGHDSG